MQLSQLNPIEQIKGLSRVFLDALRSGKIYATEEERERRYRLCKQCVHFTTAMVNRIGIADGKERCALCGCAVHTKVAVWAAQCPATPQKWNREGESVSFKGDATATCRTAGCTGILTWQESQNLWKCSICTTVCSKPIKEK